MASLGNTTITNLQVMTSASIPTLTAGTTIAASTNTFINNGKIVVNPAYNTTTNSYNEGVRINKASNNWAEVILGGDTGTTSGGTGAWIVAKRGSAGSSYGAIGDFNISYAADTGANGITLHTEGGAVIPTRLGVNGENTAYNLYVNGSAAATSFTENGTALSSKYAAASHTHTYSQLSNVTTKALVITDGGTTTTYNVLVTS